jgi:hypothetical protein
MMAFARSIEQSISAFRPCFGLEKKHGSGDCTPLLSTLQAFDEDKQEISLLSMFGE